MLQYLSLQTERLLRSSVKSTLTILPGSNLPKGHSVFFLVIKGGVEDSLGVGVYI